MNGLIAGAGLGLLVGLATLVGSALDRRARETAWRRIAEARRANHETEQRLMEWATDLEARAAELKVREWRLDRRERGPDHG